ncbi:hypothetical protein [Burkholderia ubonensis]|uniref:hypothetical protein n=1 Tax=Burkholderia ubonensis TaxID=101571 RepID=UPI000B184E93|nr:hypothetical protein [Burkholderia ubonensis]
MTSSNACRASIATRTAHSFVKIPRSTGKRATAWSRYWDCYYQWLYERKHDHVLISRNGSIPHMKMSRRALLPATPSAFSVEM